MSEIALIAAIGPAARNTGSLKYVDVLAQLHDNGVWRFGTVGAGGAGDQDLEVMLSSSGAYAQELAAGFAVAIDYDGARKLFGELDTEPGPDHVAELAALVAEIDVAIVVTGLGPELPEAEAFPASWSVVNARPINDARRSQWDSASIVDGGGDRR